MKNGLKRLAGMTPEEFEEICVSKDGDDKIARDYKIPGSLVATLRHGGKPSRQHIAKVIGRIR